MHWQEKQKEINLELGQFIALNKDIFAKLLRFIDFSEKFTLGFIEINFTPDSKLLLEALKTNPKCEEIQFVIFKCLLGLLAEAQEDYQEARVNLQKALDIYVEYKDEYWVNITREILEKLPD
ncbi:MAG: hypothetical protein RLZZ507_1669 [Cyanobacteriota bacterium]|jgi:predicted RNase H-like HicB family nuclease